jgi:hypothetical protein
MTPERRQGSNNEKRLANIQQYAFDLGVREVRPIPVALVAISLLAGGCESLRPPAPDQAVWEQEQKQSGASTREDGMEDLLYWIAYDVSSAFAH